MKLTSWSAEEDEWERTQTNQEEESNEGRIIYSNKTAKNGKALG